MDTINLLPEKDRASEERERSDVAKAKAFGAVEFSRGDQSDQTPVGPKPQTSSWWPFGSSAPKPKPVTPTPPPPSLDAVAPSVAPLKPPVIPPAPVMSKPLPPVSKPAVPSLPPVPAPKIPSKPKGPGFWSRLFAVKKDKPEKAKPVVPPPAPHASLISHQVPTKPAERITPTAPRISWWKRFRRFIGPSAIQQTGVSRLPAASKGAGKYSNSGELPTNDLEVNLIPTDALDQVSPRRTLLVLLGTAVFVAVLVGIIYGGFAWYEDVKLKDINAISAQAAVVEASIAGVESQKQVALAWQRRLRTVTKLVPEHVYWTNFFEALERVTLPNVYYTGFAGDISGRLTLNAVAPDLWTVAKQLAVFQNSSDFVDSAVVHSVTSQTAADGRISGLNFNIEISLPAKFFTTPR